LYVKSFDSKREGTAAIRTIFTHARTMAPCLLIFEDLDSLITDQSRSYFLNEVDGLESNDGILMVGSTNHLNTLDPAITKRPSRFDRKYHFRLPEEDERTAYARYWQHKLLDNDTVEFPDEMCSLVAKMSAGFSFAYLKELFVMALLAIARGGTGDEEAAVMVQRADAVAEQDAKAQDLKDEVSEKKKHVIPSVETPTSLKDNVLLKILRASLETLADEMDNTDEKEWPSTKKQAGGIGVSVGVSDFSAARHMKILAPRAI
jgi:transitional endoplasmic reticulum ATPase